MQNELEPENILLTISGLELSDEFFQLKIGHLDLYKGRIHALIGASGSGASELMYLIAGLPGALESTEPASTDRVVRTERKLDSIQLAKIKIGGQPIVDLSNREKAARIGVVFENPEWSLLGGTVLEEFLFSFSAAGLPHPQWTDLRQYGLFEKRNQSTETLSGGEKHRLNCAVALEYDRELIVVDFSASNLDSDFQELFIRIAKRHSERGTTVVILGLTPDELPPNTILFHLVNGSLVSETASVEEYPSNSRGADELAKILSLRTASKDTILSIENVQLDHMVVNVSLQMRRNEIVLIEGPNGCGKTTLGRAIATMKNHSLIVGKGKLERAKGTKPVMSFQHPEHCFFAASVGEELPDQRLQDLCGISGKELNSHPRNLSRSKQKLISVANCLSMSRGLAILDEPSCGMDFDGKKRLVRLINEFGELGILIFTHDKMLHRIGRLQKLAL